MNISTKNILVGLCKGRHEISFLSDDQYALADLDPGNIPEIRAKADAWADANVEQDTHVDLVVTGLTSACLALIMAIKRKGGTITAWHYNKPRELVEGVPIDDGLPVELKRDYQPQLIE